MPDLAQEPTTASQGRGSIGGLRMEATLLGFLENDLELKLSAAGAKLFNPVLPNEFYQPPLLTGMLDATLDAEREVSMETWIPTFLEFLANDEKFSPLMDAHAAVIARKVHEAGLRTRAFEMLFGLFMLQRAESQGLIVRNASTGRVRRAA